MDVDRRQVLLGSLSVVALAGCLNDESLDEPFELRIENRDTRSRQLWVVVNHVSEGVIYDETQQLAADEQFVEPALATEPGRYQLEVVDTTTDDEWDDQLDVELSSGEAFCGWFQIWAADESVRLTVPRCPNDDIDSDDPEQADD